MKDGMAPQKKPIDWTTFEQLCALQCTQSEMAAFLKINVDTLHDRSVEQYGMPYSEIYKKYSEVGKCSLRRYQFVLAKKNTAMAIWLGKQWLGQRDREEEQKNDLNLLLKLQQENRELQLKLQAYHDALQASSKPAPAESNKSESSDQAQS